jgi:hypothetical protein
MRRLHLIVLALAAVALCAPSVATARTYVHDGNGNLRYKPRAITGGSGVACGVFATRRMRWGHWGPRRARGRGVVLVNSGEPTCAGGSIDPYRARFRLYRPRRNCRVYDPERGDFVTVAKRIFTRIEIRFDGRTWKTTPLDGQSC